MYSDGSGLLAFLVCIFCNAQDGHGVALVTNVMSSSERKERKKKVGCHFMSHSQSQLVILLCRYQLIRFICA